MTPNFHPIWSKLSKATVLAWQFGSLFTAGSTVFIILGKKYAFKTATLSKKREVYVAVHRLY